MERKINYGLSKTFSDITTMSYRTLLKIKHNPDKLIDVTLMPVFFTIMFTYIFGGAISGDVQSYLPIIIPGVLVQTLLSTTSGAGTQLREDIATGVFDRFKSLPIARIAPLAGILIADVVRYVIAACITLLTGFIIGWRPEANFLWVIAATVLAIFTAWSLSWVFAVLGLIIKNAATIQGLSMMIMMMLTFLSSAFVPIDTLPILLRNFATINPVTHVIEAYRQMVTQGQMGLDALWTLLSSVVIILIFVPITLKLYNKKV